MGEMIDFPSNGSEGQGYLAMPESGCGPGLVVHPGVVGSQRSDQGGLRPFRGRGFRRARARPLPRCGHGRARRGRQDHDVVEHRAGGEGHGRRDRLPAAHDAVTSNGVGVAGFCMGGGLALWLATLRPDDVTRGRAVLRRHPVGRRAARLDEVAGRAARSLRGERRLRRSRRGRRARRPTVSGAGSTSNSSLYPGTEHAFTNHHRPEVYHEEHAETGVGTHDRVLPRTREMTCSGRLTQGPIALQHRWRQSRRRPSPASPRAPR